MRDARNALLGSELGMVSPHGASRSDASPDRDAFKYDF